MLFEVIDSKVLGTQISTYVKMSELKEYMDNDRIEVKDLWFNFEHDPRKSQLDNQGDFGPQIRLNFNYLYSKYYMYDQQVKEWMK